MKIGVDIGGTFTDFVFVEKGKIFTAKLLSTPAHPEQAVLAGLKTMEEIEELFLQREDLFRNSVLIHGSTVATNALLEKKGARTALITTRGFEDILEIGRQNRPRIYDIFVERPKPLVPTSLRFGISERVNSDGEVISPLNLQELPEIIRQLKANKVESVSVCLLFSFLYPAHEQNILEALKQEGFFVSASHQILPEFREYERMSTTTVNAYVSPLMHRYLSGLETKIPCREFKIMQSNGGTISSQMAKEISVHTVFSGPAGGVVGAKYMADLAGYSHIITFDMGGTSTDVSLCPGELKITSEASISGYPIRVPILAIHSVGAGGGSLAYFDEGGALRVGPESAGADPGPVCYGKGDQITVTDANLLLGKLDPDYFLGGKMKLDLEKTREVFSKMARANRMDEITLAQGILTVANSNMGRAIKVISVEKGYDPRDFVLVSFGGAGSLHACDLARDLAIPKVLVPLNPGVLSALGMVLADVVKDYSRTVMMDSEAALEGGLEMPFDQLACQAIADLVRDGIPQKDILLEKFLDMRYVGQSYEISIPISRETEKDYVKKFHSYHEILYGHCNPAEKTEIVNIRIRARYITEKPQIPSRNLSNSDPSQALLKKKEVYFQAPGETRGCIPLLTSFYHRDRLNPGNQIQGPAIILEAHATIAIPPDCRGEVDRYGNLLIHIGVR